MDSLTQIVLGGTVAYATLGPKVGKKAILYGAALGTLPDLDVLLPYGGEVEAFTYHRGFSHSLLVHLLLSPILAWLLAKLHPISPTAKFKVSWYQWTLLVFLCLSTHALLDACTVYGTQLLWPVTEYPFGFSNLFIIDPAFTMPILLAFIIGLMPNISNQKKYRINTLALGVCSVYLMWSFAAKVYIDNKVAKALALSDIKTKAYVSTPAPFSTLLWRVVAVSESNNEYYEMYASVFDSSTQVSITKYSSYPGLLDGIGNSWGVERLRWFTKGVYSVKQEQDRIILSDLRMGIECAYVFNFVVGEITQNGVELGTFEKVSRPPSFDGVSDIFNRIVDPRISLSPNTPCDTDLK